MGGISRCWASPRGGWSTIQKVNKVSVTVLDNWGNGGDNFTRTIPFDKLSALVSKSEVDAKRAAGLLDEISDNRGFYFRDTPPEDFHPAAVKEKAPDETAQAFEQLAAAVKQGVRVISAPQLFPTPADLARQLVELADVSPGQRVLEPSAGTGNLVRAIADRLHGFDCGRVVAVEINAALVSELQAQRSKTLYATDYTFKIIQRDFLECEPSELGDFDRIVMNPPFEDGADIKHVLKARTFLKPGGKLAAIVANGPRQRAALMGLAARWIDLPAGSFKESGTMVNTAMILIHN